MCFLFDFVKNLLTNEVFISYFEILIEAIFLFFVLKEFKMTRKSFEWQQKEQQEKKDKEANRQLNEIVKFFLQLHILKMSYDELIRHRLQDFGYLCDNPEERKRQLNEIREYAKEKNILNYLLKQYEENRENITKQEEDTVNKINKKFVLLNSNCGYFAVQLKDDKKEEFYNYIQRYNLLPETAKNMKLDYDIVEKIYNKIFYKKYAN